MEWLWGDVYNLWSLNDHLGAWSLWLALEGHEDGLVALGIASGLVVGLDASDVVVVAVRWLEVFDTNVYPLQHDADANALRDFNADGTWVNVEYSAVFAVVVAVRHALVNAAVDVDGNVVASVVDVAELLIVNSAVFAESTGENLAGLASETLRVCHPKRNGVELRISFISRYAGVCLPRNGESGPTETLLPSANHQL